MLQSANNWHAWNIVGDGGCGFEYNTSKAEASIYIHVCMVFCISISRFFHNLNHFFCYDVSRKYTHAHHACA